MWTGTRVYIPIPTLAPPFARGFCFSAAETRGQKNTRPPLSQRGLLIRSKQNPASVQLPGRGSGDPRPREQLPHSPERLHFSHTIDRLSARSTTLEPQRAARHHQVRPHARATKVSQRIGIVEKSAGTEFPPRPLKGAHAGSSRSAQCAPADS